MQTSVLQLRRYFVTELTFAANPRFDPKAKVALRVDDLIAQPEIRRVEGRDREWQVILRIKLAPPDDRNSPYYFSLGLSSLFEINPKVKEEAVVPLLNNSAASVLYGVAREYLRTVMSSGPYMPLLLPTLVFPPTGAVSPPARPAKKKVRA